MKIHKFITNAGVFLPSFETVLGFNSSTVHANTIQGNGIVCFNGKYLVILEIYLFTYSTIIFFLLEIKMAYNTCDSLAMATLFTLRVAEVC